MSDTFDFSKTDPANLFDQDYNRSRTSELYDHQYDVPTLDINSFSRQDIFNHNDPLKHSHKHEFPAMKLDLTNTHFVTPHEVDSYLRKDGTHVEGYYRDGDGNTSINRTENQGGGYFRTNPDGNPFNNLG